MKDIIKSTIPFGSKKGPQEIDLDPAEYIRCTDLRTVSFPGEVITRAESILNSFFIGDPAITEEKAREAARWQMVGSMALDAKHATNFQNGAFSRRRLRRLGVDPDTLEITEQITEGQK